MRGLTAVEFAGVAIDGPLKGTTLVSDRNEFLAAIPERVDPFGSDGDPRASALETVVYRFRMHAVPQSIDLSPLCILTWDVYEPAWECGRDFR